MKNVSAGLVVALLLGLVLGVGLIQAFTNFTGGIELRPAAPASPLATTMSVGAPMSVDHANSTFDVPVNIADVNNLGAYEFDLAWSKVSLLSVNSVTQGNFLGSTNRDVIELGPLTGTAGQVSVGAATCPVADCQGDPGQPRINTGPSTTTPEILSTIKFNVSNEGRGVIDLTLTNAQITDVDANAMTVTPVNTQIAVASFAVTPGSSTRYNAVSVAANVGVSKASELASYVGAATVDAVVRFNNTNGTFQTWTPGSPPFLDFGVPPCAPLFVGLNASASNNILFAGGVLACSFQLNRGVAPNCNYNFISIPLTKTDLEGKKASDLAASIGGVQAVVKYNNANGTFQTWTPGSPPFLNFAVELGSPYFVCVDNSAGGSSWP